MYKGPDRLAHRGNVVRAPENTWTAILEATLAGCEGVEVDLRLSGDGEVIVAHDCDVKRLTCRDKGNFRDEKLSDLSWKKIQSLTIPFANHLMIDFADCPAIELEMMQMMEKIQLDKIEDYPFDMALAEDGRQERFLSLKSLFLNLGRSSWKGTLELELKDIGLMPVLDSLLRESSFHGQIYLMSGAEEIIDEIQGFYRNKMKPPGVGLAANIRELDSYWMKRIEQMDLDEVGLNAWKFDTKDVMYLNNLGIFTFSNLGDTPQWWEEMQKLKLRAFKTNYLEEYTSWWKERNNNEI